jgi:hypothetical protein
MRDSKGTRQPDLQADLRSGEEERIKRLRTQQQQRDDGIEVGTAEVSEDERDSDDGRKTASLLDAWAPELRPWKD